MQWRLIIIIIIIKNEFVCVRVEIDYAVLGGVTVRHIGHTIHFTLNKSLNTLPTTHQK